MASLHLDFGIPAAERRQILRKMLLSNWLLSGREGWRRGGGSDDGLTFCRLASLTSTKGGLMGRPVAGHCRCLAVSHFLMAARSYAMLVCTRMTGSTMSAWVMGQM